MIDHEPVVAPEPTTRPPVPLNTRSSPSTFERVVCSNPPILDSLFAQITTEDALHLYHTSPHLRNSLRDLPTAWRFISWRLYQPAQTPTPSNATAAAKQSYNYSLDLLLINVINPYSTCLQSLELDNTAVSGGTLTQTVLILRRETLQHLSVRGCKNVSLKYHINPWLQMHALARQGGSASGVFPYDKLALKSLYTYRCRHHRRRPYLPSSLARKESDSEPTHDLVKTCHALGIWTDTAWCTTPGSRCFRRRGYVTMRSPQDPREVWVVFDRLWRSKNWLGPVDSTREQSNRHDGCFWEANEHAHQGEAIGVAGQGKDVPMHLRSSHRKFVDEVRCHQCDANILERCEQCSIMMHCAGCRKTLCASCAFDRPYLRNRNAPEQDLNRFWWAPGCAVSPCSMQDQDGPPPPPANPQQAQIAGLPNIKFRWCCTEPVFSGGGGISFPQSSNRHTESIRAAPLPRDEGWEDADFASSAEDSQKATNKQELAGRWRSLPDFFARNFELNDQGLVQSTPPIPRMLCDDCHSSEAWRVSCKGCSLPLCIKHDMRDRLKVRICGYRDLAVESREFQSHRKKWENRWEKINEKLKQIEPPTSATANMIQQALNASLSSQSSDIARPTPERVFALLRQNLMAAENNTASSSSQLLPQQSAVRSTQEGRPATPATEVEVPVRPASRGSNSSEAVSRSSSPAPSTSTPPITPEPKSVHRKTPRKDSRPALDPPWKGCNSFFCPAIRPAGDHRRRCTALMRQCSECKVNVCGDCVGGMDTPCPCRGCQVVASSEDANNPNTATESALFFCNNCRWSRMVTGKCKRFTEAFLSAQATQSGRQRRLRRRPSRRISKAIETRSTPTTPGVAVPDEAAVLLSEFREMRLGELPLASTVSTGSAVGDAAEADNNPEAEATTEIDVDHDDQGEIQEIEDVGQLARELITRIQSLRGQFRPGSLAAMALPDVRLIDDAAQSIILNPVLEQQGEESAGPST